MKSNPIPEQFQNNLGILSEDDYRIINEIKILLIGAGGLGGHFANTLVRLGIGNLCIVDFDVYDESNINRQLFSNHLTVGSYKVEVVKEELNKINSQCVVNVKTARIEDIPLLELEDFDYIVDAVDNVETKIYISGLAFKLNKPLLHAACGGWYGQVGWILPGNGLIKVLYDNEEGLENRLKNPAFNPAVIANIMVSEFVKFIQKDKQATINQLLLVDLYNNTMIKTGE